MGLPPGFDPGDPPPNPPPFGGGPDLSSIIGAIIQMIQGLNQFINQVWSGLVWLFNAMILLFKSLFKFLLHIWTKYIPKAIGWLVQEAQKFHDWLKRTLKPILDRLAKIKKWYDDHILKQQLRTIQLIQRIRQFLGILRLLHIKWAATLDNALVDVQNRIAQNIALIRGTLNQIINTLALAYDPTLLIAKNVLSGTLLTHLGALKRIFGFYYHGPLTTAEATHLENNVGRYQATTADGHIATLASSGLSDYDQSEIAAARAGISDVTGIPTGL